MNAKTSVIIGDLLLQIIVILLFIMCCILFIKMDYTVLNFDKCPETISIQFEDNNSKFIDEVSIPMSENVQNILKNENCIKMKIFSDRTFRTVKIKTFEP